MDQKVVIESGLTSDEHGQVNRLESKTGPASQASTELNFSIPKAVLPQPVPEGAALDHPSLYFNIELSWIDFNWRVLHLAIDERTPLLERVRFIAITASNLDEFVQKRIDGLKQQEKASVTRLSPDGRTPTEQLTLLHKAVDLMHRTMTQIWEESIKLALYREAGISICDYGELTSRQQAELYRYFKTQIYPILTPLTVDPGHPFPFISNLSLSLAVILHHPEHGTTHFGRIKVPPNQARFIQLKSEDQDTLNFLLLEQLIARHVGELFPGLEILGVYPFRVTRNADLRRAEDEATDLLAMISDELRERRFASAVRLEVDQNMPPDQKQMLVRELELNDVDVHDVCGLLDLTSCFQLADLNLPQFRYKPWEPRAPASIVRMRKGKKTIFNLIRQADLLVHHPYESFTATVQHLIEEAAVDEKVLAIKQTLYRTSDKSPIVSALIQAAERGKQVAVLVEIKARFDEANNIGWVRQLEESGVHVAYGLVGLKTHTKATLIVRREKDRIRTYCHIGTGNYHSKTARLYTDLGLMTCDPGIGQDIVNLFHYLTGYTLKQKYKKVMIAPHNMRSSFNNLIDQEIEFQKNYGSGKIVVKMNALDDVKIIRRLYQASQAGVQIDLIIRGHSRLRPGLAGYSDNIRIISILGRFLEHDRIFHFHNNGQPVTYIGSADWRGRNLDDRVELITPIEDQMLQERLIRLLESALRDNRLSWELDADGAYMLRYPEKEKSGYNFHKALMKRVRKQAKKAKKK